MTETKMIDGLLPCMTDKECPLAYACGGKLDYTAPNTKKLACLLTHIEMLAAELYKRDEPNHKCTIGDYAYQMAWVMHNELKVTAELLQKWEEPLHDKPSFLNVYTLFCRVYQAYNLDFLQETYYQLRSIAHALEA